MRRSLRARTTSTALIDRVLKRPEDRTTISTSVADRLRKHILEGELPPGTPLRLHAIAARLGVSVMPVREALRLLEAERLVTFAPRRGAVVTELFPDDIEELYAVRAALESLAARYGTKASTPEDIDDLTKAYERMRAASRADDLELFIERDRAFHRRLYEASGRAQLLKRIDELVGSAWRAVPHVYRTWQQLEVALAAHEPILEGVKRGRPAEVEKLTREHIQRAGDRALAGIREDQERRRLSGDGSHHEDAGHPGTRAATVPRRPKEGRVRTRGADRPRDPGERARR